VGHFRLRRSTILPLAVLLGLLLVWEVAVTVFRIPVYLLPAPSEIWRETAAIPQRTIENTVATLETVLLGFAVSVLVSLPIAVMIAYSRWFAEAVYPLLVFTQSIPKVALAPILVVAIGANELPRVIVTFLVAFFPLVISAATGLLATPKELCELGRCHMASWWQELAYIRFPYAVPYVFSGVKVAITLAVVGAVVGEFVAADRGLGYMITSSAAYFRTPLAYGAMVLLSLMGIVLFQVVVVIEKVFFPWSVGIAQHDQRAG
jgi:NitT/TauT family transport system permease protein